MFRFGLTNMRRLKTVGPLEIRPITILVGRNSSGKSTFLRTFPLIRQSLMTRASSPILWYGDLVDFGEYSSVVSDGDEAEKITFSFGLDDVPLTRRHFMTGPYPVNVRSTGPVEVKVTITGSGGKTGLESFTVQYGSGVIFKVDLDEIGKLKSIALNNIAVTKLLDGVDLNFSLGSLFPEFTFRPLKAEKESILYYDSLTWAVSALQALIKAHVHKNIGDQQLLKFAISFFEMRHFTNDELQRLERNIAPSSFKTFLSDLRSGKRGEEREQINVLFELNRFFTFAPAVFSELRTIMGSTLYIGPVRARSERYYRYQDLAVAEIDPDGKNFAMFLNSLTPRQREDFSSWVSARFDYGIAVEQLPGHISITLRVGEYTSNIVDVGYGISQILPVLGQIWWASRGSSQIGTRRRQTSLLAIEQPELHLHPAHQALIADAIVGEREDLQGTQRPLQFIVETHSEALVNRMGELIAARRIKAEDVQILIFEEADEGPRKTSVRIAKFDSDGSLVNWPYGFFQPQVSQ